jgi:hypothetical protein
VAISD